MTSRKDPASPAVVQRTEVENGATTASDRKEESKDPAAMEFEKWFQVLEALGCGSFGEVFNGFDRRSKTFVAIKVEKTSSSKRGSLEKEAARYDLLKERLGTNKVAELPALATFGIPKIFGFFKTERKSFLVMEKMGPSLETLFQVSLSSPHRCFQNDCFDRSAIGNSPSKRSVKLVSKCWTEFKRFTQPECSTGTSNQTIS